MGPLMPVTPIDTIPGVPAPFHWLGTPVAASLDNGVLSLTAGPAPIGSSTLAPDK